MRYVSTRGGAPAVSFTDALLTGSPSDGGAYVPETVPRVSLHRFMNASFETLMVDILFLFAVSRVGAGTRAGEDVGGGRRRR